MKTFNSDPKLKEQLVAEIIKHRETDKIVQGTYGKGEGKEWKGCAVGCAIHSLSIIKGAKFDTSNHSLYETEFGIPRVLARLEDRIFESIPVEESKTFPEKFISAVPVGVDLEMVWPKFVIWMLGDKKHGVKKFAKNRKTIVAIQGVLDLYIRKVAGGTVSIGEWQNARTAAYAAESAYAAASSRLAALAAAYAAYAARRKHYSVMASKLIEIIANEK